VVEDQKPAKKEKKEKGKRPKGPLRGPREKAQMETRGAAKRMGKEKKKKRKKT